MPSVAYYRSSDVFFSVRSEEHTSELQSHSEISYAVCCLKKKRVWRYVTYNSIRQVYRCFNINHRCSYSSHDDRYCFFGIYFFFFNDTATPEIYTLSYTLSLHDALPIYSSHIQKSRMPSSACDWS